MVQIDQDFERRLLSGQSADVQVIADGRNSNTAGTAMGYITGIVAAIQCRLGARSRRSRRRRCRSSTRAWYNPNLETRWFMIPGMIGTLTLMQTMMLTAMSVAREREQGTFDQLLVTPFRPFEIMAGKALPSMVVGHDPGERTCCWSRSSGSAFRLPARTSSLYAGLLLFLLAAVGIGLLGLGRRRDHAAGDALFHAADHAVLAALGADHADQQHAERLQYLTAINPLRYAIDITRRVYLEGAGLDLLGADLWPLALLAALTLAAAAWTFGHRMQ